MPLKRALMVLKWLYLEKSSKMALSRKKGLKSHHCSKLCLKVG